MEPEQFQKESLERLQKLEKKVFGGSKEEKYETPRETAENISDGGENHFNGERTNESAIQRVTAFYQNYDKGSVNSLHGEEFIQYGIEARIVEMLIGKYHLQQLQKELMN